MSSPASAAAMLLLFDIAEAAIDEHDHWHSHEHLPERLAIPGFRRGTRWQRAATGPRYCVLYEVANLAVLDGAAYRARLEQPTPWTAKMMAHYIGMRRTLCAVVGGGGEGIGGTCLLLAFAPAAARREELRRRLLEEALPGLHEGRGVVAWRLLENALPAPMTREQAIRGRDAAVASALWVSGYDAQALAGLAEHELSAQRLAGYGAVAIEPLQFTLAQTLSASVPPETAGGVG